MPTPRWRPRPTFDPTTPNTATATPVPVAVADLAIQKTVDNPAPSVGGNVTFTITVTNNGRARPTGVAVADLLPSGLAYVSSTPSTGSYVAGTGVWTIGTMTNGAVATLQLTATVLASGSYANTAVATSTTFDPTTPNTATATPVPVAVADLAIQKTVNNPAPNVGGNVTFTVTVTNTGPSTATGVAVADLLPSGLAYVSSTPSSGSYVAGTGVWTIGTMTNGAVATLQLTATVLASGSYANTAVATSTTFDPTTPNTATATPVRWRWPIWRSRRRWTIRRRAWAATSHSRSR